MFRRSRLLGLRLALPIVLSVLSTIGANADALQLEEEIQWGKIVRVTDTEIIFSPGCVGTESVKKLDVRRLEFNGSCKPRPIAPFSAGGGICQRPVNLFQLRFNNPQQILYATDYSIGDGKIHFVTADGNTVSHGSAKGLISITRQLTCLDNQTPSALPKSFCTEPRQWAVNFNYSPVLGNKILTHGISFYLEDERGNHLANTADLGQMIRNAFGTAITEWMGALQDQKAALSPAVQEALGHMISTSEHATLLTPPQVIEVQCSDTATFVIRFAIHNERQLVNPDGSNPKAARAEVAGRTILINGVRYSCWQSQPQAKLFLGQNGQGVECENLVPIMVHELGHALGLKGHRDDPRAPSIMDSMLSETTGVLRPTAEDAKSLADILTRDIEGAAAGRLDADGMGVAISR